MYVPADEYVPQCAPQESARGALLSWGVVLGLTLLILGAVFAAPLLLAHEIIRPAGFIYKVFSFLCHQIPERSFHLEGRPLGVCARCTGIYAGFAAGVLAYPFFFSIRRADTISRLWLAAACAPILVDFSLGFFGIWENTHLSRLATGAIFGAACALFVVPGFLEIGQIIGRRVRAAA